MKKKAALGLLAFGVLILLTSAFVQRGGVGSGIVLDATAQLDIPDDVSGIDARKTAREAYHLLEENVFYTSKVREAIRMMEMARRRDPEEPWVYITASLATLVSGYRIGDWSDKSTFTDGTVERAIKLAETALKLGPDLSQTHAHLGRLLIIEKNYKKALGHLDRAQELDPKSFYPPYFKGVLYKKTGELDRARYYFAEAEARTEFDYQYHFINGNLQDVAELTGDYAEQERLLKENIARRPDYPYYHSHYAFFLKKHGRLDEAIKHWEMAVELGPYPNAVKQLEKAKRLRSQLVE